MSADGDPSAPANPARRRWPRRAAIVSALLAVGGIIALLTIGLAARDVDRSIDAAIARGEPEPAPEFTLPVLAAGSAIGRADGELLSLRDLRGRPVVLNFWASWCDPCKREARILEAAWQEWRDRGLVVLGLDVQDLSENALDFIRRYGQTYPHVRDRGQDAYRAYGLTGVPETFFIDARGRVRVHWIGEISEGQLSEGIELIAPPEESG